MEIAAAPRCLEGKPRCPFQRPAVELGAVGRDQDRCSRLRQFQGRRKQILDLFLHLPAPTPVAARKSGRIEDNDIELLSAPLQPGQDIEHVVGQKSMSLQRQPVQLEILPSPVERFLGKIDAHRLRAGQRSHQGKGGGVGERVEQALGRALAHKRTVGPLVDEQSGGVTGSKIDPIAHAPLRHRRVQRSVCIPGDQNGSHALGVLLWQKP